MITPLQLIDIMRKLCYKTQLFMNALTNRLFADKIVTLAFWVALFLLVLYSLLLVLFFQKLPPLLPIFNQMPWGVARVGTRVELLIPFTIAFGMFVINTFLSLSVYEKFPL